MSGKTGGKTANKGQFVKGADPRRGHGLKGRSGRKPNWLKEWCDDMLSDPASRQVVERAMRGEEIPATTIAMWKAVADRAAGRPVQSVEVNATVEHFVAEVPAKEDTKAWARRHQPLTQSAN